MGYIKEPKGVDFIFRRRWCSSPTAFGNINNFLFEDFRVK